MNEDEALFFAILRDRSEVAGGLRTISIFGGS